MHVVNKIFLALTTQLIISDCLFPQRFFLVYSSFKERRCLIYTLFPEHKNTTWYIEDAQ